MCTYGPDAVVIMPSGPIIGLLNIRSAFEAMFQMLGGEVPVPTTLNIVGEVVLLTFSWTSTMFSIPDGADTYVVRWGYIQYQTVHDTIVFHIPPTQ
ncbi:MAG: nuclear transport factor 2 family protein [Myxococcales bacterium]